MQPKVMLGVIGNGRRELLDQTLASLQQNVDYDFFYKVLVDDTGNRDYQNTLINDYGDYFDYMSLHSENLGLSGSIISLWEAAVDADADYLFSVEEDFTFNEKIDLKMMIWTLTHGHEMMRVAQMALKRQACNPAEAEAGGFMQQNLRSYTLHNVGEPHLTHRNFFTLNPSVYPRWVIDLGWEIGWGEKEFSERLFSNPDVYCGYLGKIDDPPLVTHIGNYRTEGWKV